MPAREVKTGWGGDKGPLEEEGAAPMGALPLVEMVEGGAEGLQSNNLIADLGAPPPIPFELAASELVANQPLPEQPPPELPPPLQPEPPPEPTQILPLQIELTDQESDCGDDLDAEWDRMATALLEAPTMVDEHKHQVACATRDARARPRGRLVDPCLRLSKPEWDAFSSMIISASQGESASVILNLHSPWAGTCWNRGTSSASSSSSPAQCCRASRASRHCGRPAGG